MFFLSGILIVVRRTGILIFALHSLEDIYNVLIDSHGLDKVDEKLVSLAEKYERMSTSIICQGCFEREFLKLISRAKTENARTIELEQIGESFLYKHFISTEVIQIKEATHSLVYKTLWQNLDSACKGGGVLDTESRTYHIEKGRLACSRRSKFPARPVIVSSLFAGVMFPKSTPVFQSII